MALAPCHHTTFVQRPHGHQIILAAHHNVFAIRTPADAQESAEIRTRYAQQFHCVVVEYTQEAILRHNGQHRTARRETEFIDATILRAEGPSVQWVPGRFRFARQYRETVAHFEMLIARRGRGARQLLIIQIQVAGRVRYQKHVRRFWQPLQAGNLRFIDESLQRNQRERNEFRTFAPIE